MQVNATELKNNLGRYLREAMREEIIVVSNGRKVARLTAYDTYEAKPADPLQLNEPAEAYAAYPRRSTYEEYLELTSTSSDRYEYIDGEIYYLASPAYAHQVALSELYVLFYNWFKGKACRPLFAPFDVTLFKSEHNINVVQPDILVICDLDKIDDQGQYRGVPALVVEVTSPSTRRKDMLKKLDLYMQTGVQEYWLVDPHKKTALLYAFTERDIASCQPYVGSAAIESLCFPGLAVSLPELFPE